VICPFFYFYHDEFYCQCVDEKSSCCAIIEQCENKLARKSYEADIEEEKKL
jgi:hypothetical protein